MLINMCCGRRSKFSSDSASQYLCSNKRFHYSTKGLPIRKKTELRCKRSQFPDRVNIFKAFLPNQGAVDRRRPRSKKLETLPSNFLLYLSSLFPSSLLPLLFPAVRAVRSVWWPLLPSSLTPKSNCSNSCKMAYTASSLLLPQARPLLFSVLYPLNSPS